MCSTVACVMSLDDGKLLNFLVMKPTGKRFMATQKKTKKGKNQQRHQLKTQKNKVQGNFMDLD